MSLRARILLLVMAAVLPLVALVVYLQMGERTDRIDEARLNLTTLARATTQDLELRLHTADQLLHGLALAHQLNTLDPALCSALLTETRQHYPEYPNLALFLPNGDMHCDARHSQNVNVADRDYFQHALISTETQFEPILGRGADVPLMAIAHAVRDTSGKAKYVLVNFLSLKKVVADAANSLHYDNTLINLWSRDGTMLARYPENKQLTGKKYLNSSLYRFIRDATDGTTTESLGADGILRVFAVSRMPTIRGTGLRVAMGVPPTGLTAKADQHLRETLLFSIVFLLVAIVSVWLLAERSIRRPTMRIVDAVMRFSGGDLNARIGGPYASGEIGHLMEVLDQTTSQLQAQRQQIEQLNTGLEQRVVERTAELQRLQQQQERILNNVDFGIHGVDQNGRIFFENPHAATLFGRNNTEMIGQPAHAMVHHSRADGSPYPQNECPIYATLRDGILHRVENEVFWRKDGSCFPVAYTSTPIYNELGDTIGSLVAFRDVTHERELDRLKSEFVATVSHELRTPLASLLGFSELMLTRRLSEEKQQQFLEVIHKESQRLNTLINDFLDLQRIESGRITYQLKPLDVASVVKDVAQLFSSNAAHPLRLDLLHKLPPAQGDYDRIKQVLSNLLSNAVKFSPAGGEIVVVASVTADDKVEISVQDHGLGIPAEAIPQLFGKFYRVDASDRSEIGGTGLGLALCKEIVSAHQGRIWVESHYGEGSTFHFTLPLAPVATAPAEVPALPVAPAAKTGETYVLVVEDDASFATLVSEHLQAAGLAVRVEPSAEAALAAVRAAAPALVILDIHLAGTLDGWDLLIEMKADSQLAAVPVIITTITEKYSRGLALGATDFLVKPFPMETLITTVRRYLPQTGACTTLVVDDDPAFRAALSEALRADLDCQVIQAGSGHEALQKIEALVPDLILLDLLMPDMDGFELLNRLRLDKRTKQLPVLVVTGKDLTAADKEHLRHGMARVLTKAEYRREHLLELVHELLERKAHDKLASFRH